MYFHSLKQIDTSPKIMFIPKKEIYNLTVKKSSSKNKMHRKRRSIDLHRPERNLTQLSVDYNTPYDSQKRTIETELNTKTSLAHFEPMKPILSPKSDKDINNNNS